MTTNSYKISEAAALDTCTYPELKELLLDYIADQLGDATAEALEEHMLACRSCRESYLEYMKLLGSAYAAFTRVTAQGGARAPEAVPTAAGAKVLRLEDFKKSRS